MGGLRAQGGTPRGRVGRWTERWATRRRCLRGSRGASTLEYVGVLGIVVAVIGSLLALNLSPQVVAGTRDAVCEVLSLGCGADAASGDQTGVTSGDQAGVRSGDQAGGDGGSDADSRGNGDSPADAVGQSGDDAQTDASATGTGTGQPAGTGVCQGLGGCAWYGLGQLGSVLWNAGDAAVDEIVGVVTVVTQPWLIVDAIGYIVTNPLDALRQMVVDDETIELWGGGDYGGAIGRVLWNVGSWFIPAYNVGKAADVFGTLGRIVSKLDDIGELGRIVREALERGDNVAAREAAEAAGREADEIVDQARRAGCLLASGPMTSAPVVLASGGSPPGTAVSAPTLVLAAGGCDELSEAARRAQQEASDAARAAKRAELEAAGQVLPEDWDLGWDPAVRKFRQTEYDTASRIAGERGTTLERAPAGARHDWVDADGNTYDAVGNFPGQYFERQWPTLQTRIQDHMDKADYVPVDVSQFTPSQIQEIREFIEPLGDRVFIVGE